LALGQRQRTPVFPGRQDTSTGFVNQYEQRSLRLRISAEEKSLMKFAEKIREAGATGYILLWLLGIPIPILLLIFLLRGCT
jgi:hypothetical protein